MDKLLSNVEAEQRAKAKAPPPFSEQDPEDSIEGVQRKETATLRDVVARRHYDEMSHS